MSCIILSSAALKACVASPEPASADLDMSMPGMAAGCWAWTGTAATANAKPLKRERARKAGSFFIVIDRWEKGCPSGSQRRMKARRLDGLDELFGCQRRSDLDDFNGDIDF